MKINIISDSVFFPKDHGVHTAFLTTIRMAKFQKIQVVTNSLGSADVTHIHTIGLLGLYKLLTSSHTVVTAHVIPESFIGSIKGTKYWLWLAKIYLRYFYNKADLVLAVAPQVKEKLFNLGVTSRIEILPNAFDDTLFKEELSLREKGKKQLGLSKNQFVFLCVGQVQQRKGFIDFIMLAKNFSQASFIWVGGKPFKALTAEDKETNQAILSAPKNFFMKGPFNYKDMPGIYNAADIFLFPSFQENAPMAFIEAAACGLPLIVRDNTEYKMLYHQGYIACKDSEDFIKNIDKLIKDKILYTKYKRESKKLSVQYTLRALSGKLISYYTTV